MGGVPADVQAKLDKVESELELIELQIAELLEKQTQLNSRKDHLLSQLEEACDAAVRPHGGAASSSSKASGAAPPAMSKQELQRYDGAGKLQEATRRLICYLFDGRGLLLEHGSPNIWFIQHVLIGLRRSMLFSSIES